MSTNIDGLTITWTAGADEAMWNVNASLDYIRTDGYRVTLYAYEEPIILCPGESASHTFPTVQDQHPEDSKDWNTDGRGIQDFSQLGSFTTEPIEITSDPEEAMPEPIKGTLRVPPIMSRNQGADSSGSGDDTCQRACYNGSTLPDGRYDNLKYYFSHFGEYGAEGQYELTISYTDSFQCGRLSEGMALLPATCQYDVPKAYFVKAKTEHLLVYQSGNGTVSVTLDGEPIRLSDYKDGIEWGRKVTLAAEPYGCHKFSQWRYAGLQSDPHGLNGKTDSEVEFTTEPAKEYYEPGEKCSPIAIDATYEAVFVKCETEGEDPVVDSNGNLMVKCGKLMYGKPEAACACNS